MKRTHPGRGARRRAPRNDQRQLHQQPRAPTVPLTDEGFPAAVPDGAKLSPVVSVSEESRRHYPWLPARIIAGSVWRGPEHARVRVDETGTAVPWRCGPPPAR